MTSDKGGQLMEDIGEDPEESKLGRDKHSPSSDIVNKGLEQVMRSLFYALLSLARGRSSRSLRSAKATRMDSRPTGYSVRGTVRNQAAERLYTGKDH